MNPNRIIELEEEMDKALSPNELDSGAALFLYKSGHFELEFPSPVNGNNYIVRSKGWVGQIPAGPDLLIRIKPKLPVAALFGMLEVAYNLKSFQLLEGATNVNTLEEIFERIASILAHRILDRAKKGLYQAYLSRNEQLAFVRGRIDVRASFQQTLRGSFKLHCEFQELTLDLEDNQILLWTLFKVSRSSLRQQSVILAVRRAYRVLSGAVELTEKQARHCIGRFYQRLNEDYKPLHGLCRFLLEHLGPDMESGEHDFLPFKLNMPLLFEAFVAEWLKLNAPPDWIVTAQHTAKLKANAELVFRIDLLLKERISGRPIAVLDTKYKGTIEPSEADIQQIIAYAVETGVNRAFLIYPSASTQQITARVGNIVVSTLTFDISSDLNAAGNQFMNNLVARLPPELA